MCDIFTQNGHPGRIAQLQTMFSSPPHFGKIKDQWTGYTVFDAAGLILRYLKSLPEPVIPHASYDTFIEGMRSGVRREEPLNENERNEAAVKLYSLAAEIPFPNHTLLMYLMDLLRFISSRSETTSERLVATFQPSILSGPPSMMDADAYGLAAEIVVLMVDRFDHYNVINRQLEGDIRRVGIQSG